MIIDCDQSKPVKRFQKSPFSVIPTENLFLFARPPRVIEDRFSDFGYIARMVVDDFF